MHKAECIVIGGGVIGLAVGRRLAMAGVETLVCEREATPGSQTSSRNSEVIHAGLYYTPGSLKARLCVQGRQQLYHYCEARGVAYRRCGKLLVATCDDELVTLQSYADTARRNGVTDLDWLSQQEASALEPAVHCVAALWSPSTGIVSSHELLQALVADFEASGGVLACAAEVVNARLGRTGHRVVVHQDGVSTEFETPMLVNAAGLQAQAAARKFAGLDAGTIPRQYFAKGQYFTLQGRAPFSHLVYPVASAAGLGIHVTLDLAGGVRFGPDVEWVPGIDYAVDESRRDTFAAAIRRYYPDLDASRLQPGYAGIRPKIVGPGAPAADFAIQGSDVHGWPGLVNLYGIESPGLTATLAIADAVAVALGRESAIVAAP
ncbi:MAG: NAD(P)/FAD-dependent oxidoreductase [Steroidobacteraceae bacterium]|nr:NAD(P)/FAD-dependent oxidoreductase [Steroidobacteraceae bacterium]